MKGKKYNRVFVIVLDSLGVGAMPDSEKYGDVGVDTFGHISQRMGKMHIPHLQPQFLHTLLSFCCGCCFDYCFFLFSNFIRVV